MELFYSRDIDGMHCRLDKDESGHCIKVLRHRSGDEINVIDGEGTLYHCQLTDDNWKGAEALVYESFESTCCKCTDVRYDLQFIRNMIQ